MAGEWEHISLGKLIVAIDAWNRVHGAGETTEPPSDEEINDMLIHHGFEPDHG